MDSGGYLCTDDVAVSVTKGFLHDRVVSLVQNPKPVWPLIFDLPGIGDSTRTSRSSASLALRLTEACKAPPTPSHSLSRYIKVAIYFGEEFFFLKVTGKRLI